MPSFDIVSEVDNQEIDNAINQARKELATRFDLKDAQTEIISEKNKLVLTADDAAHLKALREIVIGRLSRRGVDLRNIEQEEPALSSVGHARQELKIKQGLEGNKAKEIIQAIKSQGFKVQSQLQDQQIRVTGKKKDELQTVIQFVKRHGRAICLKRPPTRNIAPSGLTGDECSPRGCFVVVMSSRVETSLSAVHSCEWPDN